MNRRKFLKLSATSTLLALAAPYAKAAPAPGGRYYLVPVIDTGRVIRPNGTTRKIFLGSDLESGTNLVRLGQSRAIIWMPSVAIADSRATELATDAQDTLSASRRAAIHAFALDKNYGASIRFREIISNLLNAPTPGVWNPLVPKRDGLAEIWLGPGGVGKNLFWSEQRAPLGPNSKDIQDTFNRADSAISGSTSSDAQFTWTLVQGTSALCNVVSNQAKFTRSGSDNFFVLRPSLTMDTTDHYSQIDLASFTWVSNLVTAEVSVRIRNGDGAAGDEGYGFSVDKSGASSGNRVLYDWMGPTIASDSTLTSSGTLYLQFNGSSYVCKVAGATIFSGTDTLYNTYKNACFQAYVSGSNSNIVIEDNFRAADLVAAPATARNRTLMGVGN